MDHRKLLRIYLQDHMAAANAGVELARRLRGSNEGTPYGDALAKLADDIDADRRALEAIARDLGVGRDRAKHLFMWAGEKAGRLKLNGQLTGYSPLSRLIELEGLGAGVSAKLSLWGSLLELSAHEPRLDRAHLERLVQRGEQQRDTLGELRTRAAREAFVG
ncbi:MAG TPA: hypothetical protein VEY90_02885 [Thermoleophilaceae bacterium]|nr:hypothetical protein [Thermoleophilaceae bacterium]